MDPHLLTLPLKVFGKITGPLGHTAAEIEDADFLEPFESLDDGVVRAEFRLREYHLAHKIVAKRHLRTMHIM